MKLLLIAVLISVSCLHTLAETYSDKYDGMNIDEVIANRRLFNAYLNCVLQQGKCTAEGKELRNHISDGLQTGCKKCTPAQRNAIRKVISYLINYDQYAWSQLVEMYDPKRTYTNMYEKELKSIKG